MSSIVLDSIAADIATLERIEQAPGEPLGYGRDLSCVDDVTEMLDEVDPSSPLGIAQGVVRRLTTPRGALPDDGEYGLDLRGLLNRGVPASELAQLGGKIRNEVIADDRIESATVTVTYAGAGLRVVILLMPVAPALQSFTLILAVTSGAVLIEALQ